MYHIHTKKMPISIRVVCTLLVLYLQFFNTNSFAQTNDTSSVIINEMMVNPLPGKPVYVEIYNRSERYILLTSQYLGRFINANFANAFLIIKKPFFMAPGQYNIITASADSFRKAYPSVPEWQILPVPIMPAFGQYTGSIVLADTAKRPIEWVYYNKTMLSAIAARYAGYAIQRINPHLPASDSLNWYTSSDSGQYGTPGYMNHVNKRPPKDTLPDTTSKQINIQPDEVVVFTPDQNGYNDKAILLEKLGNQPPSSVAILVYDRQGHLIRTLQTWSYAQNYLKIEWNGLDENGKMALEGSYFIVLSANGSGFSVQKKREVALSLGY